MVFDLHKQHLTDVMINHKLAFEAGDTFAAYPVKRNLQKMVTFIKLEGIFGFYEVCIW